MQLFSLLTINNHYEFVYYRTSFRLKLIHETKKKKKNSTKNNSVLFLTMMKQQHINKSTTRMDRIPVFLKRNAD
jgi:hypothetical protein